MTKIQKGIAGTIDCCCINQYGEFILYDWKRSKEIKRTNDYKRKYSTKPNDLNYLEDVNFNHYSLQLNLYKYILECFQKQRIHNCHVKDLYLVVFHPEHANYLIVHVPCMKEEILKIIHEN